MNALGQVWRAATAAVELAKVCLTTDDSVVGATARNVVWTHCGTRLLASPGCAQDATGSLHRGADDVGMVHGRDAVRDVLRLDRGAEPTPVRNLVLLTMPVDGRHSTYATLGWR